MRKFFTIVLIAVTVFTAQVQSAGHINRRTNINVNNRPIGFQLAPTFVFRRNLNFVPRQLNSGFFVPRRNLNFVPRQLSAGFYGQTRLQRQLSAGVYDQTRLQRQLSAGFYQNADGFRGFAAQDPGLSTQSYEYHYVRSSAPLGAAYSSTPLGAACSSTPLGAAPPACSCK